MREIVAVYTPEVMASIEKCPVASDTARYSKPVALFLIRTSAPGMTPPDESTTEPDSVVLAAPWPNATPLSDASRAAHRNRHATPPLRNLNLMNYSSK